MTVLSLPVNQTLRNLKPKLKQKLTFTEFLNILVNTIIVKNARKGFFKYLCCMHGLSNSGTFFQKSWLCVLFINLYEGSLPEISGFTACHCTLYNNGEFYNNKLLLDCLFFSPLPPPAKRIKLADSNEKKCTVPHVLQGELARLCNRFQVKPGVSTGVVQSNTLLQCSISKLYVVLQTRL